MKKVRVDFVAHCSVVVEVEEGDCMYDDAVDLASEFVSYSSTIKPVWEVEDGGVSDADDVSDLDIDIKQKEK